MHPEIKFVFVTTNKDDELEREPNRYIMLHVLDYVLITDPLKYETLKVALSKRYGNRSDFRRLTAKIKSLDELDSLLKALIR